MHSNALAECTCVCTEHANYDNAMALAVKRHQEIMRLLTERSELAHEVRGLADSIDENTTMDQVYTELQALWRRMS
jgi:hypothetical protein